MFRELWSSGSPTLIEKAYSDMAGMLDSAAKMFDIALDSLVNNVPLSADLDYMDDSVDRGERKIRQSVLEHLVVNPKKEVVASLMVASMVQDAERLGDFAAGLGDIIEYAKSDREGPFRDRLAQSAAAIRPMFPTCREAFLESDAGKATTVIHAHTEANRVLEEYIRSVANSELSADMAVLYSNAARRLIRVSAHLSNIATSVVYSYDHIRHSDDFT